jgi:Ca2+-binding EF-hand superfamily protein
VKANYFFIPLVLAASVSLAQSPTFQELDSDGDGFLSEAEIGAARNIDFYDADTSKDGRIDAEEFQVAIAPSAE